MPGHGRQARDWRGVLAQERGVTLAELMVAIAILLVGVLGTVSMIDGASSATARTKAREGATSLSRELVDVTRAIPYAALTPDGIAAHLSARPQFADASAEAGWTIERRGRTYTVEVSACALDDPKDKQGAHDIAVSFCADSAPAGSQDRNADDLRRVTVTLAWQGRHGRAERNRQTTVVTNPVGGLGPSVSALTLEQPLVASGGTPTIADPAVSQLTFAVKLSTPAATVNWSVNGAVQGDATGSGTSWTITWELEGWDDGSYVVQAQGFDGAGRSGAARKLPVVLNRVPPAAPAGLAGGRNLRGADVDLEWHASTEGDVVGYRVYRVAADGSRIARACPAAGAGADAYLERTECVDEAAPLTGPIRYAAVAVDTAPAGGLREGAETAPLTVDGLNTAPTPPVNLVACAGGSGGCTLPDGTPAPVGTTVVSWAASTDLDAGDSVAFYRIYRDGVTYPARYARVYASGALLLKYVDRSPAGSVHTYQVSGVDSRFGESALSLPAIG